MDKNVNGNGKKIADYAIESDSARIAMNLLSVGNQASDIDGKSAMWLLPVGRGWMYLSAFPDLLGNNIVKETNNARWLTQLLKLHLSESGYLIFNDYPFGLSELYDPEAFFSDSRLHNTLLQSGI